MKPPDELGRRRSGRPPRTDSPTSHERLVTIAREVFSRRGYWGTSFQEVADRAGVARPTIHYHFPNGKRQLYWAVTEATYYGVLKPAIDRAGEKSTLMGQLSVFLNVAGHAVVEDRSAAAFLCTSVAECQIQPALRHPQHDPVTTIRQFLTTAVSGAVDRGELSAATRSVLSVETLVAMLGGLGFYAAFVGEPQQVDLIAAHLHQLLIGAFRTDSS